jgi:hypothetical protein
MERPIELPTIPVMPDAGGYFALLPYLQALQAQVNQSVGPSASELLHQLEQQAARAGINPIAANCQGQTPDEYLQAFPEILKLEALLIQRINSANVSEVFQLIKETEYYKPTQQAIQVIQHVYQEQLLADSI